MNSSRNGRYTPPAPNLHGNYEGSCTVCLKGTDSGLGFHGPAEWVLAGMKVLGVPEDETLGTLAEAVNENRPDPQTHVAPGMVPGGEVTVVMRVCRDCAEASGTGFSVAAIALNVQIYEFPEYEA
jgi:hypothetical protein